MSTTTITYLTKEDLRFDTPSSGEELDLDIGLAPKRAKIEAPVRPEPDCACPVCHQGGKSSARARLFTPGGLIEHLCVPNWCDQPLAQHTDHSRFAACAQVPQATMAVSLLIGRLERCCLDYLVNNTWSNCSSMSLSLSRNRRRWSKWHNIGH